MKKYETYRLEKIEVYCKDIEKFASYSPETLAEEILEDHDDLDVYDIVSIKLNPRDNPHPHMIIEYSVQIRNDH